MSTPALVLVREGRRRSLAAWGVLGLSVVAMVGYQATSSGSVRAVAYLVAGVTGIAAVALGSRRLPPKDRRPWRRILAGAAFFLGGAVARQLPLTGMSIYVPEMLSILGYGWLCLALVAWLRAKDPRLRTGALLDVLLVMTGASLAAWALLVVPTLGSSSVSGTLRVIFALYPVLDLVLLALLVRLALLRCTRHAAYWLLVGCVSCILIGDLLFAVAVAGLGASIAMAEPWYFVAYGCIGAAALHPSAASMTEPASNRVEGWSRTRLVGVGVALLTPSLLLVLTPANGQTDRVVRAVLAAASAGLVLCRTAQAINAYAASEHAAHERSTHDGLTGLPNRLQLAVSLSEELARSAVTGEHVSVLFLDLDGFKLVNDSYGHAVGDDLLVAAAARIRSAVRAHDFVARLGGDEFVVVCRHPDLAGAEGLADRLVAAFSDPFALSIGPIFVSPSIGIAHARTGGRAPGVVAEDLLRNADAAMYKAKAGGRNQAALFDDSLHDAARARIEQETGLRQALHEDRFELHYQPVVRMSDGRLLGYEALLRWRHPSRGLILPGAFISTAEDTWLIVPIGEWVLRTALQQAALWRRTVPGVYVAVNVSARQLRNPAFADTVSAALQDAQLPGDAVCLEVTEHALVDDSPTTGHTLRLLQALGVIIAVDDFGTGYSAIGYVKRLPVRTVKIDKTFVEGLSDSPDATALVRAIVAMAEALGLDVIAEGVETAEQEAALMALGCHSAQGWRYGRPSPASAIPDAMVTTPN